MSKHFLLNPCFYLLKGDRKMKPLLFHQSIAELAHLTTIQTHRGTTLPSRSLVITRPSNVKGLDRPWPKNMPRHQAN